MSPVATKEPSTQPHADQKWTRTPAQEELVRQHQELVRTLYADADPDLRAQLEDTTIWGNAEVMEEFGLSEKGNRTSQWYTAGRELAKTGQVPHPIGAPEHDATAGHRGPHEIRGSIAGRWRLWAMNGGKQQWDSVRKEFVRQTRINSGGAPKRRA